MRKVVVVSELRFAIKPPDEDHPYGYRKAEPIASIVYFAWFILALWRHCSMSSARLVLLGALVLPGPNMLRAQANLPDVPEANPARPTVSTAATLTPAGYLQFENGALYATDSPEFSKRLGINQVSKLTLDERVELLTLSSPSRTVPARRSRATGRVRSSRACRRSSCRARTSGRRFPVST
jgi:hypothetical protein